MPDLKYSPRLYDALPDLARHFDGRHGNLTLQHLCQSIDSSTWEALWELANRDRIYDLDDPASEPWLEWVGQFVGLARYGPAWVGRGLNPRWTRAEKVDAIRSAWAYWQAKGSRWGVRESVRIWLRFPGHDPARFQLDQPLGDRPTAHPPRGWSYADPYDVNELATVNESKSLLNGDYAQIARSRWGTITTEGSPYFSGYGASWGEAIASTVAQMPENRHPGSRRWQRQTWQSFWLDLADEADPVTGAQLGYGAEREWARILPDAIALAAEATAGCVGRTIWLWWERSRAALRPIVVPPSDETINQTRRQTEWEADGFKYWDVWPSRAGGGGTMTVPTTETITFAGVSWEGAFLWGHPWPRRAGTLPPPAGAQVTETIDPAASLDWAIAWGVPWPTRCNDSRFVTAGNAAIAAQWGGTNGYAAPWFVAANLEEFWASEILPDNGAIAAQWNAINGYVAPWPVGARIETTLETNPVASTIFPGYPWPAQVYEVRRDAPPGTGTAVPAIAARPWISGAWSYEQDATTEVEIPAMPCAPGMETTYAVGTTETTTVIPGQPANQLWTATPAQTTTVTTPGTPSNLAYAADWGEDWPGGPLVIEVIAPITPMATPLAPVPLLAAAPAIAPLTAPGGGAPWYAPATAATSTEVVTVAAGYAPVPPALIALWNSRIGYRAPWYAPGTADQTVTTTQTQYATGFLCNVRDDWTRYKIEWQRTIEVPITDRLTDHPGLRELNARGRWRLTLEARDRTYLLPSPDTLLWVDGSNLGDRTARALEYGPATPDLLVEFTFTPETDTAFTAIALYHGTTCIDRRDLIPATAAPQGTCLGFRYHLPVTLAIAA